jgi:hypothetical protein
MKKTLMIPIAGVALVAFTACSDVAAPSYQASLQRPNAGNMISYCKGTIASEASTKPMYVQMEPVRYGMGANPVATVSGTAYGKRYTCQFDSQGKFTGIYAN